MYLAYKYTSVLNTCSSYKASCCNATPRTLARSSQEYMYFDCFPTLIHNYMPNTLSPAHSHTCTALVAVCSGDPRCDPGDVPLGDPAGEERAEPRGEFRADPRGLVLPDECGEEECRAA